ncbi:MAG: PEP-CTERM sorting domain-containing protein [Planctomycetaceae bacterium]
MSFLTGSTPADVITFTSRSAWLAAVDQTTMQTADFEEFTEDVRFVPAPTGVGSVDAGPFSLAANKILGTSEILLPNRVDVAPFRGSIDQTTNNAYVFVERDSNLEVTLTFDSPVFAFGADFDRVNGAPGERLDLVLTGAGSPILQAPDDDTFFGFVSDGGLVSQLVFQARTANGTQSGTGFGLDNASVAFSASAVPEPSGLLLVAAAGFGFIIRHRVVKRSVQR